MGTDGTLTVICYDGLAVSRFFRSCAASRALMEQTYTEWKTYDDSAVLNAIYAMLPWKEKPGWVEVRTPSAQALSQRTDALHERLLLGWIDALVTGGPTAAQRFKDTQQHLRDNVARVAIQEAYSDAAAINRGIGDETRDAIKRLATIKLTAQLGVAAIGATVGVGYFAAATAGTAAAGGLTILGVEAGAGAGAFGLAGLGHSVTHSVIKNWEDAPRAQVAGIAWETTKYGMSEGGGMAAGKGVDFALGKQLESEAIIQKAKLQVDRYAKRIANEGMRKTLRRKSARAGKQLLDTTARHQPIVTVASAGGKMVRGVGLAIPVLFAAWDAWDAIGDYRETTAN